MMSRTAFAAETSVPSATPNIVEEFRITHAERGQNAPAYARLLISTWFCPKSRIRADLTRVCTLTKPAPQNLFTPLCPTVFPRRDSRRRICHIRGSLHRTCDAPLPKGRFL